MSVADEITRLQNAKASLKTAINAKTDSSHQITNETIDDYASFVDTISAGGDAAKKIVEGTLVNFKASDIGATSIAPYKFYQDNVLESIDLTGVTSVGQRAFYGCRGTNASFDVNMNGSVAANAFNTAKVKSVKGTFTSIGSQAFAPITSGTNPEFLDEIDITVNGSLGSNCFASNYGVTKFNMNKNSIITSVGNTAFSGLGCRRSNPSSNIFKFDFRNSTFTSTGTAFSGPGINNMLMYFDLYLPSTVTTLGAFNYTQSFNVYYKSIPSITSSVFSNYAVDFKNFFPYNMVGQAKTATNWSSSSYGIVDSIYGYAEENTFSQGDTLPAVNAEGYPLTWYSDIDMANQVTIVSDPTQIYYCIAGTRVAVPLTITATHCSVTVSDGTNTYTNGDLVYFNTTLTFNSTGDSGYSALDSFTLNGTTIANGDTYTVTSSDTTLAVVCAYRTYVYGVEWVNDYYTTAMTRTDDAVNMTYAINSSTGAVASDFDNVFPWSSATIVTDDSGNKFLRMPQMYFRIGNDSYGDINSVAVAELPTDTGNWYKCDTFDYGLYVGSLNGTKLESKSGEAPLDLVNRAQTRTYAENNSEAGYIYHQIDLKHQMVMIMLWWIEFANKNSQSILPGAVPSPGSSLPSAQQTGGTDGLSTPTGSSSAHYNQMRYHYIEDFVGNMEIYLDGIYGGSTSVAGYVTDNPAYFSDTTDNMTQLSWTIPGIGVSGSNDSSIIAFKMDNTLPFMIRPSKTTTYNDVGFNDKVIIQSDPGYPCVFTGGRWAMGWSSYGLTFFDSTDLSFTRTYVGGRLMRQPTSNFS